MKIKSPSEFEKDLLRQWKETNRLLSIIAEELQNRDIRCNYGRCIFEKNHSGPHQLER